MFKGTIKTKSSTKITETILTFPTEVRMWRIPRIKYIQRSLNETLLKVSKGKVSMDTTINRSLGS